MIDVTIDMLKCMHDASELLSTKYFAISCRSFRVVIYQLVQLLLVPLL